MARPIMRTNRGHDFYEIASGLQKSIRRGDTKYAGYFALELFPKYHNYIWKRLLTVSAEDCAGAITQEIKALYDSFMMINKGKTGDKMGGRIFISKAVILLCEVKHNRDSDLLSNYIYDKKVGITDERLEEYMKEIDGEPKLKDMPQYIYDVHTMKGKMSGKTKRDFFIQEQEEMSNQQISIFNIEF